MMMAPRDGATTTFCWDVQFFVMGTNVIVT